MNWPDCFRAPVVTSAAISADGEWVYAMVEDEPGSEIGHLRRFDFEGGDQEDLTPDLESYRALEGDHPGSGKAQTIEMVESRLEFAGPIVGLDGAGK